MKRTKQIVHFPDGTSTTVIVPQFASVRDALKHLPENQIVDAINLAKKLEKMNNARRNRYQK